MSRIVKQIEIEGKKAIALFDTEAFHTWVVYRFLSGLTGFPIKEPYWVGLGRKKVKVQEVYHLNGEIEGLGFDTVD